MPQRTQTIGRIRRVVLLALVAAVGWLVCPAAAWGDARFSPLALSSQVCASSELQEMAPHLAALIAALILIAITLRGDTTLCLEFFPIHEAFRGGRGDWHRASRR